MRLCCPLNDTQGFGPAAEEAVVALAALAAVAAAEPARAVDELVSGWRGGGEEGRDAGGHSCALAGLCVVSRYPWQLQWQR